MKTSDRSGWFSWIEYGDWSDLLVVASVVVVCPFFLFPRRSWLLVGLLVPAAWVVTYLRQGTFLPRTPLNVFLAPLLGMVGVSVYASYDLSISLNKVAAALLGIFIFFAIVRINQQRAQNQRVTLVLITMFVAVIAIGSLFFTHWKRTIPFLAGLARRIPFGFQELPGLDARINPNPVAGTVILVIPLLLVTLVYLYISKHKRSPLQTVGMILSGGAVAILLLFVTLLSQSYSAWAGLLAGMLLVGLGLPAALTRDGPEQVGVLARMGIPIIIGGGLALTTFPTLISIVFDLHDREIIWEAALKGVQDFPFTGLGLSTFPTASQILYPVVWDGRILKDFSSTHNLALQNCLDLGFPGAIVLIAMWVASFRVLWLALLISPRLFSRCLALGCLGGLAAQLYYQVTDSIPLGTKVGLLWWVVLGLGVSLLDSSNFLPRAGTVVGAVEIILIWLLFSLMAILVAGSAPKIGVAIAVCAGSILGVTSVKREKKKFPSDSHSAPSARPDPCGESG